MMLRYSNLVNDTPSLWRYNLGDLQSSSYVPFCDAEGENPAPYCLLLDLFLAGNPSMDAILTIQKTTE